MADVNNEPELVVWNGAQWRVDRLPAGVDRGDCVSLDKWLAEQRVTAEPEKPPAKPKRRSKASDKD